jgi:glycosyltransferase involved in cell wall biosynthesis
MDSCEKPQRVAVCIASYRRPERLLALLGALDAQRFDGERPGIALVVADNDAEGSARAVCEQAAERLSLPIHYAHEPRKGIPYARNAAVAAAGDAEWIAFIDDDEIPDPRWLATLLAVQRETGADVVTGPVLPRFERVPMPWIAQGGFFAPARRPTGTALDTAFTNNALVRARALAEAGELFDLRFTWGVGEDAELFSRLAAGGARIVWADEAIVHESVPPERACTRWLLRRGFAVGTATTHIARRRRGALRAGGAAAVHGLYCVARGLLGAALARRAGRAARVRALQLAAFGAGRLAGVTGVC